MTKPNEMDRERARDILEKSFEWQGEDDDLYKDIAQALADERERVNKLWSDSCKAGE